MKTLKFGKMLSLTALTFTLLSGTAAHAIEPPTEKTGDVSYHGTTCFLTGNPGLLTITKITTIVGERSDKGYIQRASSINLSMKFSRGVWGDQPITASADFDLASNSGKNSTRLDLLNDSGDILKELDLGSALPREGEVTFPGSLVEYRASVKTAAEIDLERISHIWVKGIMNDPAFKNEDGTYEIPAHLYLKLKGGRPFVAGLINLVCKNLVASVK